METLKLEVGKTYQNRNGEEVKIVEKDWGRYPSRGSGGNWYTESGRCDAFGRLIYTCCYRFAVCSLKLTVHLQ